MHDTLDVCDCDIQDDFMPDPEPAGLFLFPNTLPVAAPLNSTPVKYAPVQPHVKDTINLIAITLIWLDDPGIEKERVATAARATRNIYDELSRGLISFIVTVKAVRVPFNKSAKNLYRAEEYAKRQVPPPDNGNPTIYAIVNNKAKNYNNAGGNTAHLTTPLIRTFLHEVGHLRPFRLGHSGAYINGQLEAYADGTSFMGAYSTTRLTGAQLYLLGWLPQAAVGLYELDDPPTDYSLYNLYSNTDGIKVVLIPRGDQRPLYLSRPEAQGKDVLMLHLSSNRGTQRVEIFGTRKEFDGVLFEKIADNGESVVVRISSGGLT